ncbi:hypothetical protein [Dactylosporangium sp. NPDC051484]|uniref:hypothetical protein n=1 Tax=Dactylosporangium sp. NPDC051484 TaxID=3154942 RepID=UPI00344BC390
MTDLEGVIRALLFQRPRAESEPVSRSVERLDDGAFHVDYHDPDHVYLVTVRQIPRIRLPLECPLIVGEVDGVRAELVQVSLANHIEVTLDAEQGPSREAALNDYKTSFKRWAARAGRGSPPPSPGEQFGRITLAISDDSGTPYRLASGEFGGTETECSAWWGFRPTPPKIARHLTLDFTSPAGTSVRVNLPLPPFDDC